MEQNSAKHFVPGTWHTEHDARGAVVKAVYDRSYRELLGYGAEEEYPDAPETWAGGLHPDDAARVRAHLAEVLAPHPEGMDRDIEYRMMTRRGYRWFHDHGHCVRRADGTVARCDGTVFDIQAAVDASALRERERKELIARMSGGESLYIVDPRTERFQILRQNAYLTGNYRADETFTSSITRYIETDVFAADRRAAAAALSVEAMVRHLEKENEYIVRYRDISSGTPQWYEMRAVRLSDTEILYGFTNRGQDIVIDSLSRMIREDCFAIFSIDLDTGLLTVLKKSPWDAAYRTGDSAPYREVIHHISRMYTGKTRDFYEQLSDIARIRRTLASEGKRAYSYRSALIEGGKWITVTAYVTAKHDDGVPAAFALCFTLMDTLGDDRREFQDQLQEKAETINGIASEYTALFHVNLDTGAFTTYVAPGRAPGAPDLPASHDSFTALFNAFVDGGAVHPDFRRQMHEFYPGERAVQEALKDRKKLSTRFKLRYGEEYLWTEMTVIKCEDLTAHTAAVGFAECDADARTEYALSRCLAVLNREGAPDAAIDELLALAGEYHGADRAYIFEYGRGGEIVCNTHEWCAPGVEAMIDRLQEVPAANVTGWVREFRRQGAFAMDTLEDAQTSPEGVALLEMQGIRCLLAAPLMKCDEIAGFIGVDNPARARRSTEVLKTVAAVAYSEILKRRELSEERVTLGKLADAFVSVRYVDLSRDYMRTWKTAGGRRPAGNATESYSAAMGGYVRHGVAARDRERCLKMTGPGYVLEQFRRRERFSVEMTDVALGHERSFVFDYLRINEEGTRLVICCRDVTDSLARQKAQQEQLQAALRRANDEALRNDLLHTIIHSGKWAFDVSAGGEVTAARLSEEAKRLLDADVPPGPYGWTELLHPGDRESVLAAFRATVADRSGRTPYDITCRMRDREGRYRWFNSAGRIIWHADGGDEFFGMHVDITGQMEAQRR